jgi:6-phosphofructokinase 2
LSRIITFTANPAVDISTAVAKIVPFSKLRCAPARKDPGGGGVNVARVIHRLGGDARALYPAGGTTGRELRRLLDEEGVRSTEIEVGAGTRENITVVEEESHAQYRFIFPGGSLTKDEECRCLDVLAGLDPRPDWVVASGSLPTGASDDLYRRLGETAKRLGAAMVVDSFGAALSQALAVGPALIKPNLREFKELTGVEADTDAALVAAARRLIDEDRVGRVALTLGERGAFLVSRSGALRAEALAVEAVSVSGAGDSFLAAMLWALADGASDEEALRYGVAGGSAAVLQPGTDLCRADDVKTLVGQVAVQRL